MELIDVLRKHGGPESDVSVQEVSSIDRLWSESPHRLESPNPPPANRNHLPKGSAAPYSANDPARCLRHCGAGSHLASKVIGSAVPRLRRWVPMQEGHYEQLVRRQRAELQDDYMRGVRRLRWTQGVSPQNANGVFGSYWCMPPTARRSGRERLAGHDLAYFTESDLPSLPVLTKDEMMAEFDRIVTVPGLTLARVQQHVDSLDGDRYLDDEYRVIARPDIPDKHSMSTAGTRSSP